MKKRILTSLALAGALSFSAAAAEKTLSEKAADTFDRAKENTKEAGRVIADKTREAADAVAEAVTPDADARKVRVKLTDQKIEMPLTVNPGKTSFVVTNSGTEKHNFEIRGEGIEKKFTLGIGPNDTKTLNVDLKPGMYKVFCPEEGHAAGGLSMDLMVK